MFSLANLLHATVSTIASRVGDVVLSLSVGWSGEISPVSLALVYDLVGLASVVVSRSSAWLCLCKQRGSL